MPETPITRVVTCTLHLPSGDVDVDPETVLQVDAEHGVLDRKRPDGKEGIFRYAGPFSVVLEATGLLSS